MVKILLKDTFTVEIRLFIFSGAAAGPIRPKLHTFTVNLGVFAPSQDGVKNRGRVYSVIIGIGILSKPVAFLEGKE